MFPLQNLACKVLILLDSQACVFHNEGFQLWMIDIQYRYISMVSQNISHIQG